MIVSQGACGPCPFSPTHYCAQSLNQDPDCGRNYAGGFYVTHSVGGPTPVHDLFWTEYGCVIGLPDKLIVRDTTGAIFCLVSGNPVSAARASSEPTSAFVPFDPPDVNVPVSVKGQLRYVFNNGKAVLLAFADPHRGTLKALIPKPVWPNFTGLRTDLGRNRAELYHEGQWVVLTGTLGWYQGDQAIYVTHPSQLKIVDDAIASLAFEPQYR